MEPEAAERVVGLAVDQARAAVEGMHQALRDVRDNWDHDEDALHEPAEGSKE